MAPLRVALGIYGLENLFGGDFRRVIEVMRMADEIGIDQVVVTDHVVMGTRTDRYPYGEFPVPPEYPWLEPLLTLAVVAGATRRIRLSTSVLIGPLRPAVLLAKQVATLDVLSGGRLDLGVGTGWQREEYQAAGIPFEGRVRRLEDQLRACQVLWTTAPASFRSETVCFEDLYCRPTPLQEGGVPLWFGLAPSAANCRRIAQLGVGWIPIVDDPAEIAEGVRRIRAAFEEVGRNPGELRVRARLRPRVGSGGGPELEATLANLDQAVAAGVTDLEMFPIRYCRSERELRPFLERLVAVRG